MWKVYDVMEPNYPEQGPLPCKRWVKVKGEKYRLKYRSPKTISRGPMSTDRDMERKARDYAYWLAHRDRVNIPETFSVTCVWGGVNEANGKWSRRISAVVFRSHGGNEIVIDLPNWNFVATVTEETAPTYWDNGEPREMADVREYA